MRSKEDHKKYYEYQTKDYLGEGGFAKVYKAKSLETNEIRAIKIIDLFRIKKQIEYDDMEETIDSYINGFHQEIKYMQILEGKNKENKNTVKFYEYFENDDNFIIVMEYCDIDLEKLKVIKKKRNENFGKDEICNILKQLNNSFKIMVENRIVHRDISLRNVLIKFENEEKTKYTVKLSDYGISKQLINLTKKSTKNRAGTFNFMAPEITEKGKFNLECDLWSIGVLIYILLFNENPYSGNNPNAIVNQINSQKTIFLKKTEDYDLDNLIKRLLVKNPSERITWKDYFSHPFFANSPTNNTIDETPNQIIIMLNVQKNDISKNIYFLENENYMENNILKKFDEYNKEIKELNEEKAELYINQNKVKNFNKYFIPEKEGKYEIKIIFKKNMTDCRFLFRNCDNIESVDLSSFDSSNVNNMNYMFGKCHFLKEVDLSNLVTDKVKDMSYMFAKCASLEKIIFPSSFNTKNVEKMDFMFINCTELSEIQFSSSFTTNNVTTMKGMFKLCSNLKNIDLKYFTSEKLTDM